jgi:hypothetical protein
VADYQPVPAVTSFMKAPMNIEELSIISQDDRD